MSTEADISNRKRHKHEIDTTDEYTILDVLNSDCWRHIFSYVSTTDLIRSERVSRQWRNVVIDYFKSSSKRTFKTSCYPRLNYKMLWHLLTLRGAAFKKLYINDLILREHHDFLGADNGTVCFNGDDCPNLEELEIDAEDARGCFKSFLRCKNLKSLYLRSYYSDIADNLFGLCVRDDIYKLERLTLYDDYSSGQFLTKNITNFQNLKYLAFCGCSFLSVDCLKSIEQLSNLTTLKIDNCGFERWHDAMKIVCSLTQLHELSLCQYPCFDLNELSLMSNMEFFNPLGELSLLKHLNLRRHALVTNDVMQHIAQTCKCLESLDVSYCDVGDEGVAAVCTSCENLQVLDVSDLQKLSAFGVSSISQAERLVRLTARGLRTFNLIASFAACLRACSALTELDASFCTHVTSELVVAAVAALKQHPRPLVLRLKYTDVTITDALPTHSLLTVIT